MAPSVSIGIALLVAALVSLAARLAGALTARGALAAAATGTAVLAGTGWAGGAVLLAFFVTSALIPRLFPTPEAGLDLFQGPRRSRQVLANGGPAALGALVGTTHAALGLWLLAAGLAAAAADTWATEIGQRFGGPPRNLVTGEPVPRGASGGVTWAGTLGGLAGAASMAAIAWSAPGGSIRLALAASLIGTLGMVLDSWLGARWQASYWCSTCDAASEESVHRCGAKASLREGIGWLNNDWVNAVSTAAATAAGGLAYWLLAS